MSLTLPLNGQPGMDGERRGRKREKKEEGKKCGEGADSSGGEGEEVYL